MQLLHVRLRAVVRRIDQLAVADAVFDQARQALQLGVFLATPDVGAPPVELIRRNRG